MGVPFVGTSWEGPAVECPSFAFIPDVLEVEILGFIPRLGQKMNPLVGYLVQRALPSSRMTGLFDFISLLCFFCMSFCGVLRGARFNYLSGVVGCSCYHKSTLSGMSLELPVWRFATTRRRRSVVAHMLRKTCGCGECLL